RHGGMAAVGLRSLAAAESRFFQVLPLRDFPELGLWIMRNVERRLIGEQQLGHHPACGFGAIGLRLDLHAGGRLAPTARRQHPLSLDLHHADAAIAVRTVTRLRGVAEMRKLDPMSARHPKDGLVRTRLDLLAIEGKGDRLALSVRAHQPPVAAIWFRS